MARLPAPSRPERSAEARRGIALAGFGCCSWPTDVGDMRGQGAGAARGRSSVLAGAQGVLITTWRTCASARAWRTGTERTIPAPLGAAGSLRGAAVEGAAGEDGVIHVGRQPGQAGEERLGVPFARGCTPPWGRRCARRARPGRGAVGEQNVEEPAVAVQHGVSGRCPTPPSRHPVRPAAPASPWSGPSQSRGRPAEVSSCVAASCAYSSSSATSSS
ncbi:hypothetical protein SAFG77S_06363 [Streptomyces afghaniensis]